MRAVENPHHPDLLRIEGARIATAALDTVLAAHQNRGFICTIEARDTGAADCLQARGFTLMRRTLEGMWQGDLTARLPDFEHGTLASRPDLTPLWLAAHKQHYAATHRANPPAASGWDEVFMGDDFRPEAAFYMLAGGQIAAFSSLRPANRGWEQAWFGTLPEHLPDFSALNMGLVALETGFMGKRGINSVLVEWDSTSPDAAWRAELYALESKRTYLTFTRAM